MKEKKIVVLMGGPSAEREVSLNTGKAILQALKNKEYNAVGLEIEPTRLFDQLKECKCDIVFNAIHGKYGEDGYLQGALELLGIPYTGSGVLANALAMDKVVSKRLFVAGNVSTPRFTVYERSDLSENITKEIIQEYSLPVVIKASTQGSSIGVSIVENVDDLKRAIEDSFKYSEHILVEEFIQGRELTVAVWGDKEKSALPIIEIVPHSGKYDYRSKYTKGATDYIVPAKIDDNLTEKIQAMSLKTFKLLGCKGIARIDVMLGADNVPYVLEVNTVPGMTETSLVPKAAKAIGISFEELCEKLLLMATK
ncbi:D-alanine--D-alanine ligase family protein [Anaerosinus sp.]|uniref:D-alanine--D-alanine ligase family protein n=1 Tax=Selenobaculum sp. TaxID=3074374 RepID=UPI0015AA362F